MSRLFRVGFMVLSLVGAGLPATAQAQFMFDMYTPYSTSYSNNYSGYSGYYGAPYSSSYAPGIGCGCNPCGCAPCGSCGTGCATGNCGSGGCAMTTNLSPSGTLQPVPDANNSRNLETRLEAIEKVLKMNPPRTSPSTPRRTYGDDGFNSVPSRPRTEPRDDFETPVTPRNPATNDNGEMFEPNSSSRNDSFRVPLPGDTPEESVIPSKKPATVPPIEESSPSLGTPTTALPLESRLTSRAVSPRQRLAISVGFAKTSTAAKSAKPAVAQPAPVNVARN